MLTLKKYYLTAVNTEAVKLIIYNNYVILVVKSQFKLKTFPWAETPAPPLQILP